ncbi:uncharacterized protein EDB91DRAFT_1079788 [Suillus paluster]|uniref:uncharacterized protein n=1 Tax=Suillus paluster TaxID=48578 RepID=UPI001B8604F0|nr:uncharacterized protein EDB91DRAFT_1079788 [Suillus paluster]KAG1747173.1 hypothetical protein EDB91DRAFT_1079788 [Suillus paluster]
MVLTNSILVHVEAHQPSARMSSCYEMRLLCSFISGPSINIIFDEPLGQIPLFPGTSELVRCSFEDVAMHGLWDKDELQMEDVDVWYGAIRQWYDVDPMWSAYSIIRGRWVMGKTRTMQMIVTPDTDSEGRDVEKWYWNAQVGVLQDNQNQNALKSCIYLRFKVMPGVREWFPVLVLNFLNDLSMVATSRAPASSSSASNHIPSALNVHD